MRQFVKAHPAITSFPVALLLLYVMSMCTPIAIAHNVQEKYSSTFLIVVIGVLAMGQVLAGRLARATNRIGAIIHFVVGSVLVVPIVLLVISLFL